MWCKQGRLWLRRSAGVQGAALLDWKAVSGNALEIVLPTPQIDNPVVRPVNPITMPTKLPGRLVVRRGNLQIVNGCRRDSFTTSFSDWQAIALCRNRSLPGWRRFRRLGQAVTIQFAGWKSAQNRNPNRQRAQEIPKCRDGQYSSGRGNGPESQQ